MGQKKPLLEDPPAASTSEEEVESGEEEEEEEVESGEEEEAAGGEGQEEEEEEDEEEEEGESESDDQEVAPKKPEPVSKPESASSSEEEEGEEEEEDEEEEEEEEEEEDSDEEGSGKDESESDEIPKKSTPAEVLRSPSKPGVANEPTPKKTVSKPPSSTAPAIAVVPISQKRPAESDRAEIDMKKKKKKTDEENGGGSSSHPEGEKDPEKDPKKLFARVWSDNDEIVVLEGMLDWHRRGVDPFADLGGFLESIKESVNATVNKDQLLNKMRRLKKKYQNNYKRGKAGQDPTFSKPHDLRCYEVMKLIWEGEEVGGRKRSSPADATSNGNDESAPATNGKKSRSFKTKTTPKTVALSDISSKELPREVQNGMSAYPFLLEAFRENKNGPTLGESLLTEGLALLGDSIAKEWEKKWRKFNEEEAEVYLKRVDLVRELTTEVLKAVKSSDS
ncbi:GLABROUS1 enhancer-binding protein-like [Papaver somniferum]|uniref:GLABROUS1 enhancer-binding protein-like n=1 Tax=Papaver somniferum TaxID=3469 RepID=UPI000E701F93|nr:GLABROUS1 enhancer-binding protein-like [Papaver somniferum]